LKFSDSEGKDLIPSLGFRSFVCLELEAQEKTCQQEMRTGIWNTIWNTGIWNTGIWNTGIWNTGLGFSPKQLEYRNTGNSRQSGGPGDDLWLGPRVWRFRFGKQQTEVIRGKEGPTVKDMPSRLPITSFFPRLEQKPINIDSTDISEHADTTKTGISAPDLSMSANRR
jgi:hypothetical protein